MCRRAATPTRSPRDISLRSGNAGMPSTPDHFSPQAADYAAFRPSYPPLFIRHFASLAPARDLAWDVWTGNGQAAVKLADHFSRVLATDRSARQLQHATPHSRVEYAEAPAESSGLPDASVDLVTIAQALHWFDPDPFHAEVARVLKPEGIIAAWSYGMVMVDDAVNAVVDWFYRERVGRYWPAERSHIETRYAHLPFPYDEVDRGDGRTSAMLSRVQLTGYIGTWSALRHARDAEPTDPLLEFVARLADVWPGDERRAASWPIFARVGRRRTP
jgi:SAM-dependent methyltransferase